MDQRQKRALGFALLSGLTLIVVFLLAAILSDGTQAVAVDLVLNLVFLIAAIGLVSSLGYVAWRLIRS